MAGEQGGLQAQSSLKMTGKHFNWGIKQRAMKYYEDPLIMLWRNSLKNKEEILSSPWLG